MVHIDLSQKNAHDVTLAHSILGAVQKYHRLGNQLGFRDKSCVSVLRRLKRDVTELHLDVADEAHEVELFHAHRDAESHLLFVLQKYTRVFEEVLNEPIHVRVHKKVDHARDDHVYHEIAFSKGRGYAQVDIVSFTYYQLLHDLDTDNNLGYVHNCVVHVDDVDVFNTTFELVQALSVIPLTSDCIQFL